MDGILAVNGKSGPVLQSGAWEGSQGRPPFSFFLTFWVRKPGFPTGFSLVWDFLPGKGHKKWVFLIEALER
jgi:hypothetical protein